MRAAGRFRASSGHIVARCGFLLGLAVALGACQPASRSASERESADAPLFAPTDVRVHPFTAVKDWTGDNRADGIEALLELQDRFRDPTKATGTALFELFAYRPNYPDPRGDRLAAWRGPLRTLDEQRMHWNRISRTYSFQLTYPAVRADRNYVLQVWFDQAGGGRRLTSQVVLEAQEARRDTPLAPAADAADAADAEPVPVTRPATRPGSRSPAP